MAKSGWEIQDRNGRNNTNVLVMEMENTVTEVKEGRSQNWKGRTAENDTRINFA